MCDSERLHVHLYKTEVQQQSFPRVKRA